MQDYITALGLYGLAMAAGISFVFQQAVNANLRTELGYPFWAGFISYLGGTIAMFMMVIVMREPLLSGRMISQTSLLSWTGGAFGAAYIAISILLLPRLGVATVVALIVLGQMIASLAFDHYGILGAPIHPAGVKRIAGAMLLMLGVVLIKQ
jgi:bacterial/archaeal transporter family-2 protein